MPGCRITKWSTELARGAVATGAGELEFDAAVADVADFVIGEEVDITLAREASGYRVARIAPVAWRAPPTPKPRDDLVTMVGSIAEAVRDRVLSLRGFDGDDLTVVIRPESYERERSIVFRACVFVQMPVDIEDVATIGAFDAAEYVRENPAATASWPPFQQGAVVFRIEPRFHAQRPGYVVAFGATLVNS